MLITQPLFISVQSLNKVNHLVFNIFCFGDEKLTINIPFTFCSTGMQLNAFNTCFNHVQTFGMRTAKLHSNWAAIGKPWCLNNHETGAPNGSFR